MNNEKMTFLGFFTVGSDEVGVIETFRKFSRVARPGLNWCIPFIQGARVINVSEQLAECDEMQVITSDKLNATTDLQVYYKAKSDEDSVMKALYAVANYESQTVNLARTTLRNIIGKMKFVDVTSKREEINTALERELAPQLESWGLELVRVELKDIAAPQHVQEAMNEVLVAEQKKVAAEDTALALEKEAEGLKKAAIQKAKGEAEATLMKAEAEAKAIKLVQETLSKGGKEYSRWYAIHRWNGQTPKVVGRMTPFLDVRQEVEET